MNKNILRIILLAILLAGCGIMTFFTSMSLAFCTGLLISAFAVSTLFVIEL